MRLDMQVEIDRSVEDVFAAWADKERSPEWAGPVQEVRKLTDGPVGVGTQFLEVARAPGGRVEDLIEITAYEPNRAMAGTWTGGLEGRWESHFVGQQGGDGTVMDLSVNVRMSGLVGKLEPLVGPVIKRAMRKDIERFKGMLEHERG